MTSSCILRRFEIFILFSSGAYVGDELPSPSLEEDEGEGGKGPTPATRQQTALPSSSISRKGARTTLLSGSECDRPDSGFDSKDDQEDDGGKGDGGSEGSPELGEMSRQAMARQPVKKKRVFHHNII